MSRPKVLLMGESDISGDNKLTNFSGPMPYVRDTFYAKVEPYADIVEVTSSSFEELARDFETKYKGVKAIYRCRAPGTIWGSLGEEFFQRVPATCKVVSHCEHSQL